MRNNIIQFLLNTVQEIKTAVCNYYNFQNAKWHQEQKKYRQYMERIQQQQFNEKVYNAMTVIAEELFQIFTRSSYHNIINPQTSSDIRIINYSNNNGKFVYYFEIDKISYNIFSLTHCKKLMEKMQHDFVRYKNFLINQYGLDMVEQMHPFIYYGLCILKIEDVGTAMRLSIISEFVPFYIT